MERTGGGGGLHYLFGAAQEWRQQAEAAKGQLSAVGSTVRLLLSHQGGRPTMESALPHYGRTMDAHDNVASRYHKETTVQAACSPNFSIPKPPT